jgi:diguanylate cyclase (GGDEF)-like protein
MARARRTGEKLTLVMCDLDNFKKVNDTYGHIEGDRVLREFGKAVRTKTRATDICGRYGGEEFAVLLPSTDVAGAANVAENIRTQAESSIKTSDGKPITASFGVAAWDDSMNNPSDFVHKADEALYKAKQGGKNRVVSV